MLTLTSRQPWGAIQYRLFQPESHKIQRTRKAEGHTTKAAASSTAEKPAAKAKRNITPTPKAKARPRFNLPFQDPADVRGLFRRNRYVVADAQTD